MLLIVVIVVAILKLYALKLAADIIKFKCV